MSTRCRFAPRRRRWLPVGAIAALGLTAGCAAPLADRAPEAEPAATEPAPSVQEPLERVRAASVTLQVLREGLWGERTTTEEGLGSGFVLASDRGPVVVTAAHVVYGATEIVAVESGGHRAPVTELVSMDEQADVAVLVAEGLSAEVQPVEAGAEPEVGAAVVLVSSPLGLTTTLSYGTVSARRPEMKALQLAAGVSPGSSGGLVADEQGRAVAIIRAKATAELGGENIALATPVSFAVESVRDASGVALPARPNRAKMAELAHHRLLTTRGQIFESYPAAASVTFRPGDRPLEHLCAQTDAPDVALAIRELGRDDPTAWRQGNGLACATVLGGQDVIVWVGTTKVGRKVDLTIRRQP